MDSAFSNINSLQQNIMLFVAYWIKTEKTPVPKKAIIEKMTKEGIETYVITNALNTLVKRGYIRRTSGLTNKAFYSQLRSV